MNDHHALMAGMVCIASFSNSHSWIVDSGATNHFTCDDSMLTKIIDLAKPHHVNLPNGFCIKANKSGTSHLKNGLWL